MGDVLSRLRNDLDELPSFADAAWSDVAALDDAPTYVPTGDDEQGVVTVVLRATIVCPACGDVHEDRDAWATRPHRTHLCESCGLEWRVVVAGAPGAELGAAEALGAKVDDLVSANRLLEELLTREQERRLAAEDRAGLAHRRAENAVHRAAQAERRTGALQAQLDGRVTQNGGAADGGSEASQAAQGSLSSAAIGAGADSGVEQPAPASAPAQQDDAAPGLAEGHLGELLRVAAAPRECPLLHTLEVGSGALALAGPDVRVSFANERGSVEIDGTYVAVRPAPGGAE